MDLKKISNVQNDLGLSEDQRPSENSTFVIEKTANDQKLSQECEPSRQLSQVQQQPEDQPAAKRKCLNVNLNEVSGDAINENNASDEMHPAHEPFTLNDSRLVIDVVAGLDTMNEDCLQEICQYLNLFDIVQFGQTCMHLESFAQRVIFPKQVKLIEIKYLPPYGFTIKLDHIYSTKSLTVLTNAIKYLGRFIEDFKLEHRDYARGNSETWQCIVNVLQNCKHLKTLTMLCVIFDSKQAQEFQDLIGSLTNLKVLNLFYCRGMIRNWSVNIKENLTIEKLSIQSLCKMEINDHFLEYFKNLSSLDLEVSGKSSGLSRTLNHFGNSLKRLKLNCRYGYQSVAPIISENLTNLEHLMVTWWSDDHFIDLPHLKSVQLKFFKNSINTVLRKLSEHGILERLELCFGNFTSECTNEPPLIFNKLQTLKFGLYADSTTLKTMTNAHMPALHTVELTNCIFIEILPELWKLIESKQTIKSLHFKRINWSIPFAEWSKLVNILREPCNPPREFLHFSISSKIIIDKKSWELLKDNHHLLKVEQERKCLQLIIN